MVTCWVHHGRSSAPAFDTASDKGEGSSQFSGMTHCTSFSGWFTRPPARLPAGTGRPLLCSIVFLNAFLNNSKRKHYCLASSHPGHLVLTVLRMWKSSSAERLRLSGTLFLLCFRLNGCLSQSTIPSDLRQTGTPFTSNNPLPKVGPFVL